MLQNWKNRMGKYACGMAALMLTAVTTGLASTGCYFMYYQPEVPDGLRAFSKNND